jgi:hypothetical protein
LKEKHDITNPPPCPICQQLLFSQPTILPLNPRFKRHYLTKHLNHIQKTTAGGIQFYSFSKEPEAQAFITCYQYGPDAATLDWFGPGLYTVFKSKQYGHRRFNDGTMVHWAQTDMSLVPIRRCLEHKQKELKYNQTDYSDRLELIEKTIREELIEKTIREVDEVKALMETGFRDSSSKA